MFYNRYRNYRRITFVPFGNALSGSSLKLYFSSFFSLIPSACATSRNDMSSEQMKTFDPFRDRPFFGSYTKGPHRAGLESLRLESLEP